MVSGLDSRVSGMSSSYGQGSLLCYWARHLTLKVSLCTQV